MDRSHSEDGQEVDEVPLVDYFCLLENHEWSWVKPEGSFLHRPFGKGCISKAHFLGVLSANWVIS